MLMCPFFFTLHHVTPIEIFLWKDQHIFIQNNWQSLIFICIYPLLCKSTFHHSYRSLLNYVSTSFEIPEIFFFPPILFGTKQFQASMYIHIHIDAECVWTSAFRSYKVLIDSQLNFSRPQLCIDPNHSLVALVVYLGSLRLTSMQHWPNVVFDLRQSCIWATTNKVLIHICWDLGEGAKFDWLS